MRRVAWLGCAMAWACTDTPGQVAPDRAADIAVPDFAADLEVPDLTADLRPPPDLAQPMPDLGDITACSIDSDCATAGCPWAGCSLGCDAVNQQTAQYCMMACGGAGTSCGLGSGVAVCESGRCIRSSLCNG